MIGITRRDFANGALAGAAACLGADRLLAAGQTAGPAVFPFGTHVFREPSLPLDQILSDLPLLKRLGFNMIKIQEVWAYDEPSEGAINLDKVERIVAGAQQAGLLVYLGLTMEAAPAWLWRKYPDATMVYEDGRPHLDPTPFVLPADGKPGPCWYHPGARAAAARFIGNLVTRLSRYDAIAFWNVWQEQGFWPNRDGHLGLDYSTYTLAQFRKWLQGKYGSLTALNAAWRSPYGSWEEVAPPRFSPNLPPMIDFRWFMDDVYMVDALAFKRDAIRAADPRRRPIFAHIGVPSTGESRNAPHPMGGSQEWRWAKALDFYGTSYYPAWSELDPWDHEASLPAPQRAHANRYFELWHRILMIGDFIRSARPDGKFWAAEMQGGPISSGFKLGRTPMPEDIRRWTLGALASGVSGISYWNHRPEIFGPELEGFALLDASGPTTPRAAEAGRIGTAINRRADLFLQGERVRPELAILVNEDLFHLFEATPGMIRHYEYTIRGLYRSFLDQGFGVDFVDAGELGQYGNRYKLVVLPMPFAMSPELMETVRAYVRGGGTIVSECGPGRMDRYGVSYNQGGMATAMQELFGAESLAMRNVREPDEGTRWRGSFRADDTIGYGLLNGTGKGIAPANYLQTLKATTAEVLFRFGEDVAGTRNRFGSGTAVLVGTLLGHATLAYGDDRNATFLAEVARGAGVRPDNVGKLRRLRRRRGNTEAWFLINPEPNPVETVVPLGRFKQAEDLLEGPLAIQGGAISVRVNPIDVKCVIVS